MFAKLHKTLILAGEILHTHWNRNPSSVFKPDGSPVTPADLEVSEFLKTRLEADFSYPVVSEESIPSWEQRKEYKVYWLVDPLDGTKEFMGRYGDFSICVALIRQQRPVLGVVYAPALNLMFYAGENVGSFCYNKGKKERLEPRKPLRISAMVSRFHNDSRVDDFCKINSIDSKQVAGGALKYCYLSTSQGAVYIRYNRMKEWDVAAGDIILHEAGGKLAALDGGQKMSYNNEDLSLPPFIATAYGVDATAFGV